MKSKTTSHSLKESSNYNYTSQVVTAVLFVAFLWLIDNSIKFYPERDQSQIIGAASLVIRFDDRDRVFEGEIVEGMTVLDALSASVEAGQINLKYSMKSDGTLQLEELNGHTARDKSINFYLNGQTLNTNDIHRTGVKAGDRIEIKFE